MIEAPLRPGARIFSFDAVANAYLARDVTVSWQSAEGDRMADALRLATVFRADPTYAWSGDWPAIALRALRFRLPAAHAGGMGHREGGTRIAAESASSASPQMDPARLAQPLGDAGGARRQSRHPLAHLAADARRHVLRNRFRPSAAAHPGRAASPTRPSTTCRWSSTARRPMAAGGCYRPRLPPRCCPTEDLRLQATSALRHAGFQYLLTPTGAQGNGAIGRLIEADPLAWDMEKVGQYGDQAVFRVR